MNKLISTISSKKIIIIITIIFIALSYIHITHKDSYNSKADNASSKYFTCITVQEGDSLTSIAQQHKTEEYASIEEYIDEVMDLNNLNSAVIVEGTQLLIPYYAVKEYN